MKKSSNDNTKHVQSTSYYKDHHQVQMVQEQHHRHAQIVNNTCQIVTRLLPGELLCECVLELGFTFDCQTSEFFCLGFDNSGYCYDLTSTSSEG